MFLVRELLEHGLVLADLLEAGIEVLIHGRRANVVKLVLLLLDHLRERDGLVLGDGTEGVLHRGQAHVLRLRVDEQRAPPDVEHARGVGLLGLNLDRVAREGAVPLHNVEVVELYVHAALRDLRDAVKHELQVLQILRVGGDVGLELSHKLIHLIHQLLRARVQHAAVLALPLVGLGGNALGHGSRVDVDEVHVFGRLLPAHRLGERLEEREFVVEENARHVLLA
mmetsp:Transcript_106269/g.307720  ORF Transcript_106269/g.307720 Transcript_106269/m.307720 type:complete len:225 (-) Transcript_106269:3664-4338(-)